MPGPDIELDLVVPRERAADWQRRLTAAVVWPAGVWAYEAHRVAGLRPRLGVDTDGGHPPRSGLDRRSRRRGCTWTRLLPRPGNRGAGPQPGQAAAHAGPAAPRRASDRPVTGDPVLAAAVGGRLGTVVDHADEGPIALALLKRGLPADTELTTGGWPQVAAIIDADSMPAADVTGAGRLAVEQLRGGRR